MRVLLTGASGQLGCCLLARFPAEWEIFPCSSQQLDITCHEQVIALVNQVQPDVIINSAAYTAVDKAEEEADVALAVNAMGAENLALAARNVGCRLIQVSTDYVFDGQKNAPWVETDAPTPINQYG